METLEVLEYRTWNISDFSRMFREIYEEKNKDRSSMEKLTHVTAAVGNLAEALRKQHITPRVDDKNREAGILISVADAYGWLNAFAEDYGNLEEMVWYKFPGVCPYCLSESNCGCIAQESSLTKQERMKEVEKLRAENERPSTLNGYQEMLDRVYGNANRAQTLSQVGYHLMEELGEVSNALIDRDLQEIRKETADVFGWLVGIVVKCADIVNKEYRLDDIIYNRFSDLCPWCNAKPCACPFDRVDTPIPDSGYFQGNE